jgi:long-chain acyl-CoA synthetase
MDNIYGRFLKVATQAPQAPAIIVQTRENVETWTYGDLLEAATNLSAWLALVGIKPGERCAILSENQPRWCTAYLGILRHGSVVVPLDTNYGPETLKLFIRDSQARILFTSHKQLDKVLAATDKMPLKIVLLDGESKEAANIFPFPAVPADASAQQPSSAGAGDHAVLLYTSGTTTEPKGVILTQGNLLAVLDGLVEAIPISRRDRGLAILPLFHILAQLTTLLVPLSVGGLVVMVNDLNASEILRALQERGITVFCCVPQFFYLIHQRVMKHISSMNWFSRQLFRYLTRINGATRRGLKLNLGRTLFRQVHTLLGSEMRLLITGGSRFDPTIARDFYNLGFEILQGYGLTECAGNATLTRLGNQVFDSVGHPVGKTEIKIIPLIAGAGDEGEIAIRGPNVMAGYHNRIDLTAEAIEDGWLLTGDLGRLDSSGRLYVTGRKKEVIVLSSGKNIHPEELESHYQRSPFLKELCIVPRSQQSGMSSPDRLHAVVVPDMELMRQEGILNIAEKIRYEMDNRSTLLPAYQRVHTFQLSLADLPRTTTRKLKRHEVTGLAIQPNNEPKSWSEADLNWLDDVQVKKAIALIREQVHGKDVHPSDRLDLDLDQDSLGRVELMVGLQEAFETTVPDHVTVNIHTVRELIDAVLATSNCSQTRALESTRSAQPWRQLLASDRSADYAFDKYAAEGPTVLVFLLFVASRFFLLAAKLLLRLKVHGQPNLQSAPLLLCPNHQTYFDGLLVACVLPWQIFRHLFFVGSPQYFTSPLLRWLARKAHIILLDTESNVTQAMRVCAFGLRSGKALLIFPEGERTIDGALGEFRKGAAILSSHTGVPIVPIGISGAFEIWPRAKGFQKLNQVTLSFGQQIPAAITPDNATPAESEELFQAQTTLLAKRISHLIEHS